MTTALPDHLRSYLMATQNQQVGQHSAIDTGIAAHACECAEQTPDIYPGLTGIPGWGRAEINDQFVPGPFWFTVKPDDTNVSTFVLSGVPSGPSSTVGLWSTTTNNTDHIGDPNLTQFMPPSADFSIIVTRVSAYVAPIADEDPAVAANQLGTIAAGLRLLQNENGNAPFERRFYDCVSTPAAVLGQTAQAAFATSGELFSSIARRADIRNGYLAVQVPAVASQPYITIKVDGFALNNAQFRKSARSYTRMAWLDAALRSYPTGLVGPIVAKLIGTKD